MNTEKKGISTYDIVAIALMAAFVFVATYFFKIDLPTIGGKTSIKLGNGICILAALLLGGWRGALSAAIGCTLFDLLDPIYAKEAWITFIRYFIMAGLCGTIAHWHGAAGKSFPRNVVAAIVGAYSYSAMYIGSKIIGQMALGASSVTNAVLAVTTNITASLINATAGVIVALVLVPVLRRALEQTTFGQHVYHNS